MQHRADVGSGPDGDSQAPDCPIYSLDNGATASYIKKL
jgi:hypothetical protein